MSQRYRRLLAKRSKSPDAPDPSETLPGHILDVLRVSKVLIENWGDVFLGSMGLSSKWVEGLREAAIRGAFLHDVGKANHQFQRLLRQGPIPPQAFRHEWLSLFILLRLPTLDQWLFSSGDGLRRKAALFAAVGHHLQIPDGNVLRPRDGTNDSKVVVAMSHPDVTRLFQMASMELNLAPPHLSLPDLEIDLLEEDPLADLRPWLREAYTWWQGVSSEGRRFVALVKAIVIAADVAGSVIPRSGLNAVSWVKDVLSRTCQRVDLERLATRRLHGQPIRSFQSAVVNTSARVTLVRAGCGSGKTTAAYLWASRHAPGRKLFFCYPTTGTATEGYADYVLPDEIEGALIHSRSEVDLEELRGAPDCEGDFQIRLEALAAWDVPLIVCTADTVLGLIQNNRRGLFSFPTIANGAFVFDEVHAYDDRMFGALLRFVDAFRGVPILLMTASLPKERVEMLEQITSGLGECLGQVEGPIELEMIPRYHLRRSSLEDVWSNVRQLLIQGGKILWVANTVDRAVAFAQEACRRGFNPVTLYHSRYRYCDRLAKHRAIVEAFHNDKQRVLAITTQVCEVSLDLSADLLVTDLAPVPALIQRLGRLNRYVTLQHSWEPKTAIVIEPGSALPYEDQELAVARRWLDMVGANPVSQADLAKAFLQTCGNLTTDGIVSSAWLDGGPFSSPAPLREPGATIPVIRKEDEEAARVDRKQIVRMTIPMLLGPVAQEVEGWQRLGVVRVAPPNRIVYSEEWGAGWRK